MLIFVLVLTLNNLQLLKLKFSLLKIFWLWKELKGPTHDPLLPQTPESTLPGFSM